MMIFSSVHRANHQDTEADSYPVLSTTIINHTNIFPKRYCEISLLALNFSTGKYSDVTLRNKKEGAHAPALFYIYTHQSERAGTKNNL